MPKESKKTEVVKAKVRKTPANKEKPKLQADEVRDVTLPSNGFTGLQLRVIQGEFGFTIPGGLTINKQSALTLPVVWSCVDLIASTIASLEYHTYKRLDTGGKKMALDHSVESAINLYNHEQDNRFKFWRCVVAQCLTFGYSVSEIERDAEGNAYNLHLLDPRNVEIRRKRGTHELVYHLKQEHIDLDPKDVLHFNTLGYFTLEGKSPVRTACTAIGIGVGAQLFVENFLANGATPTGVLVSRGRIDSVAQTNKKEQFTERQAGVWNAGKVVMLEPNYDYKQIQSSFVDSELNATRAFVIKEIARVFRVPLSLLGENKHSYNSSEEANTAWVNLCLRTWLTLIETECNKKLFKPQDRARYYTEFRLEGLLRGNLATRAAYYQTLFNLGAINSNEVRANEGLNPYPGGERFYIPTNNLSAVDTVVEESEPDAPAPNEGTDLFNSVHDVIWNELGRCIRRGVNAKAKGKDGNLLKYVLDTMPQYLGLIRQFQKDITVENIASLVVEGVERISDPSQIADYQKELTNLVLGKPNRYDIMLLVDRKS